MKHFLVFCLFLIPAFDVKADVYCYKYGNTTVCENDETNKEYWCYEYGNTTVCEE